MSGVYVISAGIMQLKQVSTRFLTILARFAHVITNGPLVSHAFVANELS